MISKIKELIVKNRELVLYALFGILTTIANAGTFLIMGHIFGKDGFVFSDNEQMWEWCLLLNNTVAWLAGVIVAFVTNKIWVFNSKSWRFKIAFKEFSEFIAARVFSYFVEQLGLYLFFKFTSFGDGVFGQMAIKLGLSVIVVLMNYIFSKYVIFKKKKKKQ